MNRYITVPEPFVATDPITREILKDDRGEPARPTYSFAKSVRTALFGIQMKGDVDLVTINNIARKVDEAPVGAVVELNDEEYKLLEPALRIPNREVFNRYCPFWALGGGDAHVRAVTDAKSSKPAVMTEEPKANGTAQA